MLFARGEECTQRPMYLENTNELSQRILQRDLLDEAIMKTTIMIIVVAFSNVISQLVLKKGVIELKIDQINFSYLPLALTSPYVLTALLIQIFSYIVWLFVLSRTNLGYAVGLSGAMFYIIIALLGWWVFNEKMTPLQWIGLFAISFGVFCLVKKTI
jgi:drug/metabolite transporter (DMT)-like permease